MADKGKKPMTFEQLKEEQKEMKKQKQEAKEKKIAKRMLLIKEAASKMSLIELESVKDFIEQRQQSIRAKMSEDAAKTTEMKIWEDWSKHDEKEARKKRKLDNETAARQKIVDDAKRKDLISRYPEKFWLLKKRIERNCGIESHGTGLYSGPVDEAAIKQLEDEMKCYYEMSEKQKDDIIYAPVEYRTIEGYESEDPDSSSDDTSRDD